MLLRALKEIPSDIQLWQQAVSLEPEKEGQKALLKQAVECVPTATSLWLALARAEEYPQAREVLNTAISNIPTDHTIWISAAKLEEENGHSTKASEVIKRAFKRLPKMGADIPRDKWLTEAVVARKAGSAATSDAIVKECLQKMDSGVTGKDQKTKEKQMRQAWIKDAHECATALGSVATARAILVEGLKVFPGKRKLWDALIELELKADSDISSVLK